MRRVSRRAVLRGAGGLTVALPLLGAMEPRNRDSGPPKRLVVFFTPFGLARPPGRTRALIGSRDLILDDILSPLARHRDALLVVDGVDMECSYHGPGDPHQKGIGGALTGIELQSGELFPYADDPGKLVGWGGGISLDQCVGEHVGRSTPFATLELGVRVASSDVSSRLCYAGPGRPVPPQEDPRAVFTRLFGGVVGNPVARASQRRRVLAAVRDDFRALTPRLGREDRDKVEAHLETIDDLDARIREPRRDDGSCGAAPPTASERASYPDIGSAHIDLLTNALACDLTRVATIQWSAVHSGEVFDWLGHSLPHHTLSHASDTDADAVEQLRAIGRWYASQLATLLDKLAAVREHDGSLLDNTAVLWCSDVSTGNTHERRDMPYVLAGRCGGALSPGRRLAFDGVPHNELLLAIAHAMDVPIETFGNADFCRAPLSGLGG